MTNKSAIAIFYIPCKNQEEADHIARSLLDLKLVACTNTISGESRYEWNDQLCADSECYLIAKSFPELADQIEEKTMELHSYDLPCIARWTATVNSDYHNWMRAQIKK